jgi:hypothetical protein
MASTIDFFFGRELSMHSKGLDVSSPCPAFLCAWLVPDFVASSADGGRRFLVQEAWEVILEPSSASSSFETLLLPSFLVAYAFL